MTMRFASPAELAALLEMLALQGVRTAYGCVTAPNEKSERLHEAMGFRRVGVRRNVGYKAGAWRDVAWFERAIGPYEAAPVPVRPIRQAPRAALEALLDRP